MCAVYFDMIFTNEIEDIEEGHFYIIDHRKKLDPLDIILESQYENPGFDMYIKTSHHHTPKGKRVSQWLECEIPEKVLAPEKVPDSILIPPTRKDGTHILYSKTEDVDVTSCEKCAEIFNIRPYDGNMLCLLQGYTANDGCQLGYAAKCEGFINNYRLLNRRFNVVVMDDNFTVPGSHKDAPR